MSFCFTVFLICSSFAHISFCLLWWFMSFLHFCTPPLLHSPHHLPTPLSLFCFSPSLFLECIIGTPMLHVPCLLQKKFQLILNIIFYFSIQATIFLTQISSGALWPLEPTQKHRLRKETSSGTLPITTSE